MTLSLFLNNLLTSYQAAPSADNSQPCCLSWEPPILTLRYDTERVGSYTFPYDSQAILLAAGAALENILRCCDDAGVGAEVTLFPEGEGSNVYAEISLQGFEAVTNSVLPDFVAARHTNRHPYKKEAVPKRLADQVESFGSEIGVDVKVVSSKADIALIAKQVQVASEIRFQTQEVHEWLEKSLRFTAQEVERGDGLDVETLALPPGGGAFLRLVSCWARMKKLNRIGAYKLLAAIDSAPVRNAPALLAISASDSMVGGLDAGRVMCRAWSYLNAEGLACHPYYVISDQLERLKQDRVPEVLTGQAKDMRKNCQPLFDLKGGQTLMMLLRVGYPKKQALRSRRLSLEKVFKNLSDN